MNLETRLKITINHKNHQKVLSIWRDFLHTGTRQQDLLCIVTALIKKVALKCAENNQVVHFM